MEKEPSREISVLEELIIENGWSEKQARNINLLVFYSMRLVFVVMVISFAVFVWDFHTLGCGKICSWEYVVKRNETVYSVECKPTNAFFQEIDENGTYYYYFRDVNSFEEGEDHTNMSLWVKKVVAMR